MPTLAARRAPVPERGRASPVAAAGAIDAAPGGVDTAPGVLGPIPRADTLGDVAYERMRHALMSGQLRPGEQVSVRGVAEAFGISMTPAREAMGRLVAEGTLAEGPHRTVVVPRLTRAAYAELMEIRLALEPLAAARAVEHVTPEALAGLQQLQDQLLDAHGAGRYDQVLRCNEAFHFGLYRLAGMPTLVALLEPLWLRIGPTLTMLHEAASQRGTWRGDTHHRAVLSALARRDAVAVAAAVRDDLQDGRARLIALMQASSGTD